MQPPNVYCTGHTHSEMVCTAFAAGCDGKIVPPAPLLPGDVFMYGALRGLKPTLDRARAEGRTWLYADNGYFRPGHYDGFYRVTRNALQHDGSGQRSAERFMRLGLTIEPWREGGRHVLVCPPSDVYGRLWGMDPAAWLRDATSTLRRNTGREIRVRSKAAGRPLAADLEDCWAVVTHSSNAAVEALLAGIPVFCTAPCASWRMGRPNIAGIEAPARPDNRLQWASNLAANQWTLAEMRDGTCWRDLTRQA